MFTGIAGEISVTEKDTDTLSVSDAAGDRSQEAQLHSLLRTASLPASILLRLRFPRGIEARMETADS